MSVRPRFTNPATGQTYDWPLGHAEEEDAGKERQITRTVNTGQVGAVKQQGDDGPYILSLSGHILTRAQYREFWHWYRISSNQTIHYRDFDGQVYEVQITDFKAHRVRTIRNRRDASIPNHYWAYNMQMEVYTFISGDLKDMGVTP